MSAAPRPAGRGRPRREIYEGGGGGSPTIPNGGVMKILRINAGPGVLRLGAAPAAVGGAGGSGLASPVGMVLRGIWCGGWKMWGDPGSQIPALDLVRS